MKLGAIEAGGTKFVVCVGDEFGNVIERDSFPTETPEKTMANIFKFFDDKNIEALGVGCFGPIDPDLNSSTYGYITSTPKIGWQNFNIMGVLKERYNIPMGFDTDVNGAALGEAYFGAAKGLDSALYMTIGTEGLAAGPAIEARWGKKGFELPEDHPAWDLEAYYIGQALANYILIISPKKIILGGGVSKQKQMFPLIYKYLRDFLNGYVQKDEILTDKINDYIVSPALGDNAGVCGALALAKQALLK